MKSRVVWKLLAVVFCDNYFARKQSDLATESDDEIVRVYFIKCNSVFEWRLYMLYYSATGCSFRWYCLDLKLTSEKMFLISLTKRIARWSWLLKNANDLYFHFISFPGWKDHFSVFWYYFFYCESGKAEDLLFWLSLSFPEGREGKRG